MLVLSRDIKVGKYQKKHEDIVYAQGLLDQVTRQELKGAFGSAAGLYCFIPVIDKPHKGNCQNDPHSRPNQRFANTYDMIAPMEDAEVYSQHAQHKCYKRDIKQSLILQENFQLLGILLITTTSGFNCKWGESGRSQKLPDRDQSHAATAASLFVCTNLFRRQNDDCGVFDATSHHRPVFSSL
jgi:hypothetical protein